MVNKFYYIGIALCLSATGSYCINRNTKVKPETYEEDLGDPLILTPLISEGRIDEARDAARVTLSGFDELESYAGFLTVDEQFDSNLFFWFFPSETDPVDDPVIMWLTGGPGATSMIALLRENGPIELSNNGSLSSREWSWTAGNSIIYVDNPVGSGFSYTSEGGLSQNDTALANNLYQGLLQFFQLFPELQTNDFFVSGESYAGKYVPAISHTILVKNRDAEQKINLKGLTIGNGWCDPEHQLDYSEYLYQIGLIDANSKPLFKEFSDRGVKFIQNQQWVEAFGVFDSLINGDLTNEPTLFKNVTGFDNYLDWSVSGINFRGTLSLLQNFTSNPEIRRALHVGNNTFHAYNPVVEENLVPNFMVSVAPWISELLSSVRVLIYNGQRDIIIGFPLSRNMIEHLNFTGAEEYKAAVRKPWFINGDIAAYIKQAGNLTEVMIRNSGHLAPNDQPEWTFTLLLNFLRNLPYEDS